MHGGLISLEFHNNCMHRNFLAAAFLKSPVMLVLMSPFIFTAQGTIDFYKKMRNYWYSTT
jgi:hypothetical protein